MKKCSLLFFIVLLFILSCSTQKKSIKYAATVIDRQLVNSLYEGNPVFSSYENVSLFIDSLAFIAPAMEPGGDGVNSAICQVLIDETAKIEKIYFHQSAGAIIDSVIIQILNSARFNRYRSEDANNPQKYSIIVPFYIVSDRILSPYLYQSNKNSKKKPAPDDKILITYDTPPLPIGGFQKIQDHLIYPEIARKAGIEGDVMIKTLIDEQGFVEKFAFLKSNLFELEYAAAMALLSVRWKPALREGSPQKVWVAIPIRFKLK